MEQVKKMPMDYFARNDHAFVYSIIYSSIHYISALKDSARYTAHHTKASGNDGIANEMAHVIKKRCLNCQLFF